MGAGFAFGSGQPAAWAWLDEQAADVALLQEVVLPQGEDAHWDSIAHSGKYDKAWGSGIFVKGPVYKNFEASLEYPWLNAFRGSVTIAKPELESLPWLVSIHSHASVVASETLASHDLSSVKLCSNVSGEVWEIELIAHDLERLLAGRRYIVGGDFNSSLLFDTNNRHTKNQTLFQNLHAMSFVDLRPRHHAQEQRTFFQDRKGHYQLDHVYADLRTEELVTSWKVLPEVASELNLSDHAPIVVEIEAEGPW